MEKDRRLHRPSAVSPGGLRQVFLCHFSVSHDSIDGVAAKTEISARQFPRPGPVDHLGHSGAAGFFHSAWLDWQESPAISFSAGRMTAEKDFPVRSFRINRHVPVHAGFPS